MKKNNKMFNLARASLLSRAIAYIIDTLILLGVSLIVFILAFSMIPTDTLIKMVRSPQTLGRYRLLISMTYPISMVAYFTIFESRLGKGATIGKRLLKIKVVDASADKVRFSRSFLRNIVRLLWAIPCFGFIILILETLLIAKSDIRIGDILANTYVVKYDQLGLIRDTKEKKQDDMVSNKNSL